MDIDFLTHVHDRWFSYDRAFARGVHLKPCPYSSIFLHCLATHETPRLLWCDSDPYSFEDFIDALEEDMAVPAPPKKPKKDVKPDWMFMIDQHPSLKLFLALGAGKILALTL